MKDKTDILYRCLLLGSAVLFIDQATKYIANKFHLITLNPGISFGLLETEHPALSFLLLLGMGVLVAALIQQHWHKHPISTGLFVGGAISNIVDRVAKGGVRDWLPIFFLPLKNNLADWAIFLAAVLVIITVYQESRLKPQPHSHHPRRTHRVK
jgi:signal peptidase II